MTAETALTSVDIMSDGVTIAAGSVTGKVYIYDLRQGTLPVHTIHAHDSTVNRVVFHNNYKHFKVSLQQFILYSRLVQYFIFCFKSIRSCCVLYYRI